MREPTRFLLVQFNVMSNLTKGFRRDLRRLQPPAQSGAFVRGEEVVDAALAVVELPVLLGLGGVITLLFLLRPKQLELDTRLELKILR